MKLRKTIKFLIISLLILISLTFAARADWQFVSPMPHGRYGHDATLGPDGKIYVMGGMVFEVKNKMLTYKKYNDGRYSNLVYDSESDAWQYLEPVPGWGYLGQWMTYDQEKQEWQYHGYKHGMTIPEDVRKSDIERQGNGVSIVAGKDGLIYWIGGNGKYSWLGKGENIVFPYDPLNSTWAIEEFYEKTADSDAHGLIIRKNIPDMQERRIDHRAVILSDGRIFVLGGYRKEELRYRDSDSQRLSVKILKPVSATMECYDPKVKKWRYRTPLKSERMLFAAVVGPDDKIYVFGGAQGLATRDSTPILDTTEVYDPVTDTWTSRRPMPAPRDSHDAILAADGKIYIMGGAATTKGPPLKDVFVYDPVNDSWQKGPSMNYPRANLAAVATPDGKIYVTGGTDVGTYKGAETINKFLPRKKKVYAGKVQDTVEVLDIFNPGN